MKAVCMISGGIDSPVAAQIAVLNGFTPFFLHYHNYPFHSLGTLEKVVKLVNRFTEINTHLNLTLTIIKHGRSQEAILNNLKGREIKQTCLFCRLLMFRKAENYAERIGADVNITGEILGEQASQTLTNLSIVNSKTTILTLRPLIGYNKDEVTNLSKKWGFYHFSILPGGCCSINPRYPETNGDLKKILPVYNKISMEIEKAIEIEEAELVTFSLPVQIDDVLKRIET